MALTDKCKFVCENDVCKFYKNNSTDIMDNLAKKKKIPVTCFIAEQKSDKTKEYVLVDYNGKVIYANQKSEDVWCHIEIMHMKSKGPTCP